MKKPKLINTPGGLDKFIRSVSGEEYIAVDSESNSFFAHRPRVCLIQISSNQSDFIVDPLSLGDLSALGAIFADPTVEKVLHAAENDLIGLKRDFGFGLRNIFDTAVACRLLGWKRLGLAKILSEEFGVHQDKKFQRYNWERRPLNHQQLYYAQLDTHFLIQLRHRLHKRLLEDNLEILAQEQFVRLENIRHKPEKAWNPEGYLYIKGAEQLPAASLRVLRELFAYRERVARRTNKAPFRVMNNQFMVNLARQIPKDRPALLQIRGLPAHFKGKGASALLQIVKKSSI